MHRAGATSPRHDADGYLPIEAYGAIGNLRSVALIGIDGSIDWCCFPHVDSPSVFAALLDAHRGGRFRIGPAQGAPRRQVYRPSTNVLETSFDAHPGLLTVTDFMPLAGDIDGRGTSDGRPELHRVVRCEGAAVDVTVEWSPRFDYARGLPQISEAEHGWVAEAGSARITLGGLPACSAELLDDGQGPLLRATFRCEPEVPVAIVSRWGTTPEIGVDLDEALRLLDVTCSTWRGWVEREETVGDRAWAGRYEPQVMRSELALKLLAHGESGALAAAATTSLPEHIGGVRNWDYRYGWIRDSAMSVQALGSVGHVREAIDFLEWAEEVSEQQATAGHSLQIMYGLLGRAELPEHELPHLDGYRGSRPVRIGNKAVEQRQPDIHGELLDAAYELVLQGVELSTRTREFLADVADRACHSWQEPDDGIWETRCERRYYTYSRLMVWVALERAVELHRLRVVSGDVARWAATRERVRQLVLDECYNPDVGAFVQAAGSSDMDAAMLLIPIHEFLPVDDPRVQGTIDRVIGDLTVNGLVYRYRNDDGLPGEEGAFGLCTFWLVDALALSRRLDEAWHIFEQMAARANHVGLFPEQIDPCTGSFLGNMPQAFTHLGLINSILYLRLAEGRSVPVPGVMGRRHRHPVG